MRPKLAALGLAVLVLGVAACGRSTSSSSTSATSTLTVLSGATGGGRILIYRAKLTGAAETPPGAPQGIGDAIIAFHGSSVVCWRFAHLHGFTSPTFAHIHIGANGRSGNIVVPLSTGPRLHHQGCATVSGNVVRSIERSPQAYYVNIHSAQYPSGAVRGQL
jgi:CHRD domain